MEQTAAENVVMKHTHHPQKILLGYPNIFLIQKQRESVEP